MDFNPLREKRNFCTSVSVCTCVCDLVSRNSWAFLWKVTTSHWYPSASSSSSSSSSVHLQHAVTIPHSSGELILWSEHKRIGVKFLSPVEVTVKTTTRIMISASLFKILKLLLTDNTFVLTSWWIHLSGSTSGAIQILQHL